MKKNDFKVRIIHLLSSELKKIIFLLALQPEVGRTEHCPLFLLRKVLHSDVA